MTNIVLQTEVKNWQLTALAMRDAAIAFNKTKDSKHLQAIEDIYFNAAMRIKFTTEYHL